MVRHVSWRYHEKHSKEEQEHIMQKFMTDGNVHACVHFKISLCPRHDSRRKNTTPHLMLLEQQEGNLETLPYT